MAATTTTTVSSTLTTTLTVSRVSTTSPSNLKDTVAVTTGSTAGQALSASSTPAATKSWVKTFDLAANTPITLDLTALTGGQGDADLTGHVWQMAITNHATTAGYTLTVGNAASTIFSFGLGGTTPTIDVAPGMTLALASNAGWVVSASYKSLKLDPGVNAITCTVSFVSGA